jgi:hypothetical protein
MGLSIAVDLRIAGRIFQLVEMSDLPLEMVSR